MVTVRPPGYPAPAKARPWRHVRQPDKPIPSRAILALGLLAALCSSGAAAQSSSGEEIVVVAERYGEADVAAEVELPEDELAAYGADSVAELIEDITPLIDGSGEPPVLLINGEPAGELGDVGIYPPEVLNRIAILKREAAARYGYPPNRRVVNLVLKKSYASWQAEGEVTMATAGGRGSERVATGRLTVAGPTRWNARLQLSRESALLRSERPLPAESTDAVETRPTQAASETLLPMRRGATFTAGATRQLGPFSASLALNASGSRSEALLGLPTSAVAPDDESTISSLRPLRNVRETRALGLSLLMTGSLGEWRTTLTANYLRNWADSLIEGDPGATTSDGGSDLAPSIRRSRSRGETIGLQARLSRPIVTLPAGAVTANLTTRANRNRSRSSSVADDGTVDRTPLRQDQLVGQASLAVPLTSRGGWGGAIGELSADLAFTGQLASRTSLRRAVEIGANWSPLPFIQLRGSVEREQVIPAFDELGAPRVEEIVRIYDYLRQETAEPVRITGGNPELAAGSRERIRVNATLRPLSSSAVTLNIGYRSDTIERGSIAFPALTPAIEAAFPDRIERDAAGRLLSIDARPINIVRDSRAELTTGLTFRMAAGRGDANGPRGDPFHFTATITHRWQLEDELIVRPGMAAIDQLAVGGQSPHALQFRFVAGQRGFGATLSGNWTGPGRIGGGALDGDRPDYIYPATTLFDFELFVQPEHLLGGPSAPWWAEDLKLSLDIRNLFDGYRRITLANGETPPGYGRYEVDPLGRTIALGIRKSF